MRRYICVHGHFYQPPRENPWLEAVEQQDSAHPYHDWNERITAECYAPNTASRILDGAGRITRIVNNYAQISFNLGPTLLSFLEGAAPSVYRAVLQADRESQGRFSGHGSAIAQVYNHAILPLCNDHDRRTQVRWGVRDFEQRFGRRPEGMWLAETAANTASLEALAEAGVAYTLLAPRQARRVRRLAGGGWKDVAPDRVDPSRAYLVRLPSGRSINVFFYDGPISRAVAFEGLLSSGERLAARLCGGFSEARGWPQLVHIATDGETYGHHHPRGDMALAYALHHIEAQGLAELTNYGEFLERHPPTHEVEIEEDTSWSCAHGIERWRGDCGCNSGLHAGWGQGWRTPLREALDFLRDRLAPFFEARWRARFQDRDPWAARDAYIDVVLDRSQESVERFLHSHAGPALSAEEQVAALRLLEMQRHAMLMYTSCGWFFDELSGLETVQVLRYACRALQLARQLSEDGLGDAAQASALTLDGGALEQGLLQRLSRAQSNIPEHRDGRQIYERLVAPSALDLQRVGTHYSISSLFSDYERDARIYCYQVERLDHQHLRSGKARLSLGRARLTSLLTTEQAEISFGALHMLDHHITGGVRPSPGAAEHAVVAGEIADLFQRGDLPQLLRAIDLRFGPDTYSLRSLFYDEQRRILEQVLADTLKEAEDAHRRIYRDHADLLRFLSDQGAPVPRALRVAAQFALNTDLRRLFRAPMLDAERVRAVLAEVRQAGVTLDEQDLEYALRRSIERIAAPLRDRPENLDALCRLDDAVALAREVPFAVNFWEVQNTYYGLLSSELPRMRARAALGDEAAGRWAERVAALGERLQVQVPEGGPASRGEILREAMARRRTPRCTYRLQFSPSFTFRDAARLVPYLHALGVSDLYASPVFRAPAGSPHGYDVCDHGELNPELGGEAGFDALSAALRERGMGLVLDVVPNHMGIATPMNPWWMDVLENGRSSAYAVYFDIDWHPATPELGEKVLLSILEDQYGKVLEDGKLRLHQDEGSFHLRYYDHRWPVAPRTYVLIMGHALPALEAALSAEDPALQEYKSILTALSYLPPRTETDPARLEERGREKEVIKRRLAALQRESAAVRAALEEALRDMNGVVGDPRSFDLLDQLIEAQAYRLAYWRVAAEEINYRRFFDINELAAIRVEVPEVFEATHRLVLRLLIEGKVTGLRVDHADGLWDPLGYLRQLQTAHFVRQVRVRLGDAIPPSVQAELEREAARWLTAMMDAGAPAQAQAQAHAKRTGWPLYVVAEKILAAGEELPASWPVDGTTGYDFLTSVGGLFLDPRGEAPLQALYRVIGGVAADYPALVHDNKKMTMRVALASEINALGHKLERISERNRRYRDYTLNGLIFALREIVACLQVYRTYITGPGAVSERDRRYVEEAVEEARGRNPGTAGAIFDFVRDTLLLRDLGDFRESDRDELLGFTMKFQQITGPVMAKAVEDTAFYVYNRLVSLNEVGGDPSRWGTGVEEFHAGCAARLARWPHAMLATSTHDTKRGEDVRARVNVLSEMPQEWEAMVARCLKRSATRWGEPGQEAPSRNDQYLLLQTLIGSWPEGPPGRQLAGAELAAYRARIADYMRKATREAKVHTAWINPNEEYEAAVMALVAHILSEEPDELRADVERMARRVAYFGRLNGLSQRVLHLCAPGVPDLYQGAEVWALQLVDPDNRRPVDFAARLEALEALERDELQGDAEALCQELLGSAWDGRIKLYVTWRVLGLRREHPALFEEGGYEPIEVRGERAGHLCAFARILQQEGGERVFALVVAPRLVLGLVGGAERPPLGVEVWGDTHLVLPAALGAARCRDVFTGAEVAAMGVDGAAVLPVAEVLRRFPVAVLHGVAQDDLPDAAQ